MLIVVAVYLVVAVTTAVLGGGALDRMVQGPRLRAAWDSGLTAEARCTSLRTEETSDAEGAPVTYVHPTLEFRTTDGRTVSFEETEARITPAEGDAVTVYYDSRIPDAATARRPSFGPRHARTVTPVVGCVFAVATAAVLALVV